MASLLGMQMATFSPWPHLVFPLLMCVPVSLSWSSTQTVLERATVLFSVLLCTKPWEETALAGKVCFGLEFASAVRHTWIAWQLKCEAPVISFLVPGSQEVGPRYKSSRPPPSNSVPPARLHLLKVPSPPKTILPTGEQAFKPTGLRRYFTFKP